MSPRGSRRWTFGHSAEGRRRLAGIMGIRVLGFRVCGLGFRVWVGGLGGLGFRGLGFGGLRTTEHLGIIGII